MAAMTKKEKEAELERKAQLMFEALFQGQQQEQPILDPASQATLGRIAAADTLHGQKMGNIQSQADAASGVYGQMGQPLPAGLESRIASALSGGLRAKNPMLSAPQSPAEVAPGQGAFVPGMTNSGRIGGAFVQAPLPSPGQAGLDRVAASDRTGKQTGFYALSGKNPMVGSMSPSEADAARIASAPARRAMEERMNAKYGRGVNMQGIAAADADRIGQIMDRRAGLQSKIAGKNPFAAGGDDIVSRAKALVAAGGGSISMDQAVGLVEAQDRRKADAEDRALKRDLMTSGAELDKERFKMQTETERLQQDTLRAQRDSLNKTERREAEKTLVDPAASIIQKQTAADLLGKPYKPSAVEIERESVNNLTPFGRSALLDDSGMVDPEKAREALADHISGRKKLSPEDLAVAEKYAAPADRTWLEYMKPNPEFWKPLNPFMNGRGVANPGQQTPVGDLIRGIQSAAGR